MRQLNWTGLRVAKIVPTMAVAEQWFAGGHHLVAGMDEVGRGSLAGPVTVGIAMVTFDCGPFPEGLADSKFLSDKQRLGLQEPVKAWLSGWAVGEASNAEIDRVGIIKALRLAGQRAVAALPKVPDVILLDGNHDYLSDPDEETLWNPERSTPTVQTHVKGDANIAVISAASVLAKEHRDSWMTTQAVLHPAYGWEANAGYSSPTHIDGLKAHGASALHRTSFRLPGIS